MLLTGIVYMCVFTNTILTYHINCVWRVFVWLYVESLLCLIPVPPNCVDPASPLLCLSTADIL